MAVSYNSESSVYAAFGETAFSAVLIPPRCSKWTQLPVFRQETRNRNPRIPAAAKCRSFWKNPVYSDGLVGNVVSNSAIT